MSNKDCEKMLKEYYEKAELELVPEFFRKHLRFVRVNGEVDKVKDRIYDVKQFRSHLVRDSILRSGISRRLINETFNR